MKNYRYYFLIFIMLIIFGSIAIIGCAGGGGGGTGGGTDPTWTPTSSPTTSPTVSPTTSPSPVETMTISGKVKQNDIEVSGNKVTLQYTDGTKDKSEKNIETITDTNGTYFFPGIIIGKEVIIIAENIGSKKITIQQYIAPIDISDSATMIVAAYDEKTQKPVENVKILINYIDRTEEPQIAYTNAEGKTYFANLRNGKYIIAATKDGYNTFSDYMNLSNGYITTIGIYLDESINPTPTPTTSPVPSPTPTTSPTVIPSPNPTPSPTTSPSPSPTFSPNPSPTPSPSPSPNLATVHVHVSDWDTGESVSGVTLQLYQDGVKVKQILEKLNNKTISVNELIELVKYRVGNAVMTDSSGNATLENIIPGSYNIWALKNGYTLSDYSVNINQGINIFNIKIEKQ